MNTKEVKIGVKLNQYVWSKGVKHVPTKVRVTITRKRNEDEEAKEDLFSYVEVVEVDSFSALQTRVLEN